MNDFTWSQVISEYFQGELTFCENNSDIILINIIMVLYGNLSLRLTPAGYVFLTEFIVQRITVTLGIKISI